MSPPPPPQPAIISVARHKRALDIDIVIPLESLMARGPRHSRRRCFGRPILDDKRLKGVGLGRAQPYRIKPRQFVTASSESAYVEHNPLVAPLRVQCRQRMLADLVERETQAPGARIGGTDKAPVEQPAHALA